MQVKVEVEIEMHVEQSAAITRDGRWNDEEDESQLSSSEALIDLSDHPVIRFAALSSTLTLPITCSLPVILSLPAVHSGTLTDDNETMRWRVETSGGSSQHEIHSRLLLDRADSNQHGLFECEVVAASSQTGSAGGTSGDLNGEPANEQQAVAAGDKLRRLFGLLVNGKY